MYFVTTRVSPCRPLKLIFHSTSTWALHLSFTVSGITAVIVLLPKHQSRSLTCICRWKRICGASGLSERLRGHDSAWQHSASGRTKAPPPPRSGVSCCAHTHACHRGDQAGRHTRCVGQLQRPAERRCFHVYQSGHRPPTAPGIHAVGAPMGKKGVTVMGNVLWCTIRSLLSQVF